MQLDQNAELSELAMIHTWHAVPTTHQAHIRVVVDKDDLISAALNSCLDFTVHGDNQVIHFPPTRLRKVLVMTAAA